jgi:PAS domain S-box-containing protein
MRVLHSFTARLARRLRIEACGPTHHPRALDNRPNLLKLAVLLSLACLVFQTNAGAQLDQTRRVLIFNELESWSPHVATINQEIFAALEKLPYHIEFYTEDLDTNLLQDKVSQRQFRDWYFHKYRDRKPDLIIAVGPSPIKLMAESHQVFAPNTPIVFWGSVQEFVEPPRLDSNFTGVWGTAQPEKTLDAALHLQPGTKHVVVVGGVAPYDRRLETLAKQQFRNYESKLDFTYLTNLAMPDLLERLKHLPRNTIVYHTSMMQDAAGTQFDDETQSVPMVASAANAPVFAVDEEDVGRGTVGGDVFSSGVAGRVAAGMAARILNGEKPQDIPIFRGANMYLFDWRALRRWELKESNLPPGSVVLEREPTFWELYRRFIMAGILVLLAQTLAIIALVWQRAKRRQTEARLVRYSEQLRMAMESGKSVGWEWDLTTGRDSWFGDLRTMFGISSDTFTGKVGDFFRYVHPDDRKRVQEAVADARQDHKPYAAEFRVVRADGATRWVVSRGTFKYGRKGEATRMLGMAVDITERIETEEALKSSEEKFSKAFRESPLAVTLTSIQDNRYLEVNDTFERLTGWRREEVLGRTSSEIRIWVDPAQREEFLNHVWTEGSVQNLEVRLRRKDGELRTVLGSAELIEINGKPCALSVISDVTDRKRMQEKLGESQNRLEGIIASAMDGIIAADHEHRIVVFNAAAEKMFGCRAQEAIGSPINRFIPERFRSAHTQHIRHFGAAGVTNRAMGTLGAFWALRANGEEFPIEVSISQQQIGNDKLFTAIIRDITERERAEEARRESEERARELVQGSPIAMVVTEGAEQRNIMVNDRFTSLFGYTLEDVPDVAHWWPLAYPDEAYRSTVRAEWEVRVEKALRNHTDIEPMEASVRCKDGSSRYVEFHFSPAGHANVVSFVDLTDRKRAEMVLQESEERFRHVANTAPVMIWMSGVDRLCTYFNSPWLRFTGRSIHEELGNGWTKGVHPEDLTSCVDTYTKAFDQRKPFQMEYRLRQHDGDYRWILDLGVPRYNLDGSFEGYIGSCIDVTDRKLAEEALSEMSRKLIEAQEQERKWIARELHDDINQQIALLAVNLERLKQDIPALAPAGLQRLEEILEHASGLGSEIQALSHRLHSSKLEYLGLGAAASSFCRELSDRHGVEIDFHSKGVPKELRQEIALCLFRVLQESLQNAIKHSGSQRFEVCLRGASNEIELTVLDSGIGFNPEEAIIGRGLGLTSMRERLKLVNGKLSIDSRAQLGTTIRATVPLSPGSKAARA